VVLKRLVPALVGAASLALAGAAMADEYRADEYFNLDLSKAVLSPKRLGPPQEFAPVAVEAKSENKSETKADRASGPLWARHDLKAEPRKVAVQDVKVTGPLRVTHPHRVPHIASENRVSEKPKGSARIGLAHRHRNPLDAQAMDTRIEKWPCKSGDGGICDWK
jgi:hypothetical protein